MAGVRFRNWVWLAALALSACTAARASTADAPPEMASQWIAITPEPTRIDGRMFTATCSQARGTDPAYRFWFHQGTADGLVVFFDGGGACWDDITCAIPRLANDARDDDGFYKAELVITDDPNRFSGIFDLNDARNPVRDWSFVYVPYCTGDVHSGSNTAHYKDPDTGEPYTIEHRGADNFRVILRWMRDHVAHPQQILVAGSSAGAYGASTHYARIREAYPRGRAMMLGDAGQGVMTQEFLDQRSRSWHFDLPRGVLARNAAITEDTDLVGRLAARYPGDRFGQYTTAQDITQSSFYALMGAENACTAWTQRMTTDLLRRQSAPNFRSYLAAGETHSILRTPRFYTEQSGGAPLAGWLGAMLSESGAGWQNRACQACMTRVQRCIY
jgi:hypothetical protein